MAYGYKRRRKYRFGKRRRTFRRRRYHKVPFSKGASSAAGRAAFRSRAASRLRGRTAPPGDRPGLFGRMKRKLQEVIAKHAEKQLEDIKHLAANPRDMHQDLKRLKTLFDSAGNQIGYAPAPTYTVTYPETDVEHLVEL